MNPHNYLLRLCREENEKNTVANSSTRDSGLPSLKIMKREEMEEKYRTIKENPILMEDLKQRYDLFIKNGENITTSREFTFREQKIAYGKRMATIMRKMVDKVCGTTPSSFTVIRSPVVGVYGPCFEVGMSSYPFDQHLAATGDFVRLCEDIKNGPHKVGYLILHFNL